MKKWNNYTENMGYNLTELQTKQVDWVYEKYWKSKKFGFYFILKFEDMLIFSLSSAGCSKKT